ncbi:MAG: helix-turn-helix domain-containing protein [Thermomicrobiales bacterium]
MDETRNSDPVMVPAFCPAYHHAIELIGRRWSGVIVRAMIHGATRYSDISAAIPGMSDRLLSERLKELEAEGVLVRTVVPSTPVRVDYTLTAKGQALAEVVAAVATWAEAWAAQKQARGDVGAEE